MEIDSSGQRKDLKKKTKNLDWKNSRVQPYDSICMKFPKGRANPVTPQGLRKPHTGGGLRGLGAVPGSGCYGNVCS